MTDHSTNGGEARVQIQIKSTPRGNIATMKDETAPSGARPMTDAEMQAIEAHKEVINAVDADAHEHGDVVAVVIVEDGECTIEWGDDVVRKDARSTGGFASVNINVDREIRVPTDLLAEDSSDLSDAEMSERAEDWFWNHWKEALTNEPAPSKIDVSVESVEVE